MKALLCFVLGVVVGAFAHSYLAPVSSSSRTEVVEGRETGSLETPATNEPPVVRNRDHLNTANIKEELEKTGRVIREKTREAGAVIADAAANTRISTSVKAKLVQDAGLSAFKIDVDTTDGVVTLSGTVKSHEEIARAVDLAFQTEGVRKVISTLQVK
jgi:hypothetical protein